MPEELKEINVQSLMNEEKNGWDYEVIEDICNARDRELITRVPIPITKKGDSWFWLLESSGKFTVRSCYKAIQGDQSDIHARFWNRVWSLQLPVKVTVFLWRVARGCLPTNHSLGMKRVDIDVKCPWCHKEEETDSHVLFTCDFAKTTWAGTGFQNLVQQNGGEMAFEILVRAFSLASREQCVQIGMFCWSLWNRRNKWVWERANGSVFGVKAAAMNLLNDWREARREDDKEKHQEGEGRRRWSRPPVGWVKLNIDAAIHQNGSIGVGSVLRDCQGSFIRAKSTCIPGAWQPREAEAIGLKEALSWAKAGNLHHCIIETDSKLLELACRETPGDSYFHTIVSDCVYLLKHLDNVLVEFVYRSANNVAHVLAKAAFSESDLGEWFCTPPEFIHHVLNSDIY